MAFVLRIKELVRRSTTLRLILLELLLVTRISRALRVFILCLAAQFVILMMSLSLADSVNSPVGWMRATSVAIYLFAITSLFPTAYGQYYFSWDAPYFPLLFSSPLNVKNFIRAKLLFLLLATLLPAILLIPLLAAIHSPIMKEYICTLIYNAGAAPPIVVYLASFNYRKIKFDTKGVFFNYEGMGKSNLIIGLLLSAVPVAGLIIAITTNSFTGYYIMLFLIGLVNIFLFPIWERRLTSVFLKKKYTFLTHFDNAHD